jgi:hypothetical protein
MNKVAWIAVGPGVNDRCEMYSKIRMRVVEDEGPGK